MEFKPQDLLFIVILITLLLKRSPNLLVVFGLTSLFLSIPLFQQWVFFTAQRLTWYAFVFFLIALLLNLFKIRHNK